MIVLQDEGIRYHPDVVVVGFFVHNIYRNVLSFRDYAKPKFILDHGQLVLTNVPVPTPREVLAEGLRRRPTSYALHWILGRLRRVEDASKGFTVTQTMLDTTRALLAEMHATCRKSGARMLVVIIPNPPRPAPRVEQAVVEWGREIGYATLSLKDPLSAAEKQEGKPTYYLHFSRFGNVVAARAVLAKLLALGWVRPEDTADPTLLDERQKLSLEAKPLDSESMRTFAGFLARQGKVDEAIRQYLGALAGESTMQVEIHTNLGSLFRLKSDLDRAEKHYQSALELAPKDAGCLMNLGNLLLERGEYARAEHCYRQAIRQTRPPEDVHARLATALARQGKKDEAIQQYRKAIELAPDSGDAYAELSDLLVRDGRASEALDLLRQGLARTPHHVGVINNLAWLLATCPDAKLRDGKRAMSLIHGLGAPESITDVSLLDTIAAVCAEVGRFDEAVQVAQRAAAMAGQKSPDAAKPIESRLALYRARRPYRASPPSP
ncbi:MAG: tetratricopeptide repeat protein [Phycisphaerae bacterium]|nr:tetratricopeptide repeat protein [Phycisphaerae bacterium]